MPDAPQKAKGGKKGRKVGRNSDTCKMYKLGHRREHNKIKRLRKRLLSFPDDAMAKAAIERCEMLIRGVAP